MKDFILIANHNCITYKEFFPFIHRGEVHLGYNKPKEYDRPDGTIIKAGDSNWFTTMYVEPRNPLILTRHYTPEEYPTYDNYDAIEVSRTKNIPADYDGVMGVPITFLDHYSPEQFEIIGGSMFDDTSIRVVKHYQDDGYKFLKADGITESGSGALRDKTSPKIPGKYGTDYSVGPDGKCLTAIYQRIFIRRKK